jgi:hypothetical protein
VAGITWVRAAHESPRGHVAVAWKKENGVLTLDISLPPNTTGEVSIPTKIATGVLENGRPATAAPGVKFLRETVDRAVFAVDSGHYEFSTRLDPP